MLLLRRINVDSSHFQEFTMSNQAVAKVAPVASPVVPAFVTAPAAPMLKTGLSDDRLATWNKAPNASPALAPSDLGRDVLSPADVKRSGERF